MLEDCRRRARDQPQLKAYLGTYTSIYHTSEGLYEMHAFFLGGGGGGKLPEIGVKLFSAVVDSKICCFDTQASSR